MASTAPIHYNGKPAARSRLSISLIHPQTFHMAHKPSPPWLTYGTVRARPKRHQILRNQFSLAGEMTDDRRFGRGRTVQGASL